MVRKKSGNNLFLKSKKLIARWQQRNLPKVSYSFKAFVLPISSLYFLVSVVFEVVAQVSATKNNTNNNNNKFLICKRPFRSKTDELMGNMRKEATSNATGTFREALTVPTCFRQILEILLYSWSSSRYGYVCAYNHPLIISKMVKLSMSHASS